MGELERTTSHEVEVYDPEKGLQSIAAAEVGEKYWRRAKDQKHLFEAIELKLKAQAEYVVWRDSVVVPSQKTGSSGVKGRSRITELKPDLPKGDPGNVAAHRWRKRLCYKGKTGTIIDKDKIKLALDDAQYRCARIVELENANTIRGTEGTGEFERYTPAEYIEAARLVMGSIDLDPATSAQAQEIVQATQYFTEKDDGLKQEWDGNVWLNPPYHRELAPKFIKYLVKEYVADRVKQAIVLTNNSTDTEWFLAAETMCASICFTSDRVPFYKPNGEIVSPTQGQAFFYLGPDPQRFEDVFCTIGFCMKPSTFFVDQQEGADEQAREI